MDDDALTKALYVGVSIFVTVITISALIVYYNIARKSIKGIGGGTDFDTVYREDVKETLLKSGTNSKITGTQVKNLINYYYDNIQVEITISKMKYISDDGTIQEYAAISLSSADKTLREKNYNTIMKYIMNNQYFTLTRNIENEEKLVITIEGE